MGESSALYEQSVADIPPVRLPSNCEGENKTLVMFCVNETWTPKRCSRRHSTWTFPEEQLPIRWADWRAALFTALARTFLHLIILIRRYESNAVESAVRQSAHFVGRCSSREVHNMIRGAVSQSRKSGGTPVGNIGGRQLLVRPPPFRKS